MSDVIVVGFIRTGATRGKRVPITSSDVATDSAGTKIAPIGSTSNKYMTASVTSADNQEACSTAIAATPGRGGHVQVLLNGMSIRVGDGTKTGVPSYFSGNSGTTARAIASIVSGDKLYWNGSVANYELDASDRFDFVYAT